MTNPALNLVVDAITCVRGGRLVLDRLSFICEAGTPLIVRGPNGSGKSTLLRAVAGLVSIAGGAIRVTANRPENKVREISELIHYVGHVEAVKPVLTVRENLAFWAAFLGTADPQSVEQALSVFGLGAVADLPAQFLSAGQRRRTALARLATVHRPIWLLDEPSAALDAESLAAFRSLIAAHSAEGGVSLVATHDALDIADARVIDLSSNAGGSDR